MKLYRGFKTKQEAIAFQKKHNGQISWLKSDTEKRAKAPALIKDCYEFGLDREYQYAVVYEI